MTAVIEVVRPEDADELDALVARCSVETRYRRFFAPVRTMPTEYRAGALAGDPARHDAVATRVRNAAPAGRIVALASLVAGPDPCGPAELGVLVEDGWQRRGLGTALVRDLVARARVRRVPSLRATVLPGASGLLVWLGRILPMAHSEHSGNGVTGVFRLL
jgi:GNAT superfamily N-acetyltransferase